MPQKAVHLLVLEGFADWEPAHAVAELRRQYKGWSISVEEDTGTSRSFLARKIAS